MPVFFVASLVSRAFSVWMSGGDAAITSEHRQHQMRRVAVATFWIPVTMAVAAVLGMRGGVLDHVGSTLAPVGNAMVALLVFVFAQLSRPIFWLVDRLGIDPEGVRRLFDRIQGSANDARDRALRRTGDPSLLGRLLGLALLVLLAWSVARLIRRIRPATRGAEARPGPTRVAEASLPIPPRDDVPGRAIARRLPPADRVRRWYAEILAALAGRGVEKDPAITPGEFAATVTRTYPECAGSFRAITSAYEDVRYGSARLDRETIRALDTDRRSILAAIRRRPPEPGGR
jgi:hypothetical protein